MSDLVVPDVAGRDLGREGFAARERWVFDAGVAAVFDDMLARSIPGYADMRQVVTEIARPFLSEYARIVDLGASRGEAVSALLEARPDATVLAVEIAPPMADAARSRLAEYPRASVVEIDLRESYPPLDDVDVVLCVLTLQFVPVEYRLSILERAHASLRPGGALILVEKILGGSPGIDRLFADAYRGRKRANGYSEGEIDRKRLALEGVLVPLSATTNEANLASAGFAPVERVWQSLNFAAWVAVA